MCEEDEAELHDRINHLETTLEHAVENLEYSMHYVGDYLVHKWSLDEELEEFKRVLHG